MVRERLRLWREEQKKQSKGGVVKSFGAKGFSLKDGRKRKTKRKGGVFQNLAAHTENKKEKKTEENKNIDPLVSKSVSK